MGVVRFEEGLGVEEERGRLEGSWEGRRRQREGELSSIDKRGEYRLTTEAESRPRNLSTFS